MSRYLWDELDPGDRGLYCPGCGEWLEWGQNPRATPLPYHGGPDGVCPASAQTLTEIGAVLNGDGTTEPLGAAAAFASLTPAAQTAGATVKERLAQIGEALGQRPAPRA